ncbi:MAG: TetR/AcrR family transcriptional regulator [Clostridia bacterium]|nr:TetR/AcrR family transcriptional regulator [Clostridia bacterium]
MSQKENDTKQYIIQKALELIKANGFDQVTINDICAAAEVSKHTFYYYFKSKETLLLDFFQIPKNLTAERISSILAAEHHVEQFWNILEHMGDFFIDLGHEITRRIFIANFNRDMGTFNSQKINNEQLTKAEVTILTKGYEKGEFRNSSNPLHLLHIVFIEVMGITAQWCILNGGFDLKNSMRVCMEVSLDVIPELRKAKYSLPQRRCEDS